MPAIFYQNPPPRTATIQAMPETLYVEVTNRCNLLCQTCPRTFDIKEKDQDLTLDRLEGLLEQLPGLSRLVLHGVGEPLLNPDLPEMVRRGKAHGAYVLFNTNGTLLTEAKGRALIEAGLDELRVSLDAATPETYKVVRGAPVFDKIIHQVAAFRELQAALGVEHPRVSLWFVGTKENIHELPAFIELAARLKVGEAYLQRMTYGEEGNEYGSANASNSIYQQAEEEIRQLIEECHELAGKLGVRFFGSGAVEPREALKEEYRGTRPWSVCKRPWMSTYISSHGTVFPCCIAPFAETDYTNITLGNAFQEPLAGIWNNESYQGMRTSLLSDEPWEVCRRCGVCWSL